MKVYTKDTILTLLNKSDLAVQRAVLAIYKLQTEEEKCKKETSGSNNIGFNKFDAKILSSFAEQLIKGHTLTPKQLSKARDRIKLYHRQLTLIANGKLS